MGGRPFMLALLGGWSMLAERKNSRGGPRERIDIKSAVRRLFPAFAVTFWAAAQLMRQYNIAHLGQSPGGRPVSIDALIWGVFALGMLLLNKWWLPPISERTMIYVGIACGILSAVAYSYLPYMFAETTNPVHYYFKHVAAVVLAFNIFPLLPALVLAGSFPVRVTGLGVHEAQPA